MAYGIKYSLLACWLMFIIAIFLWYRNYRYDRIVSVVAIIIGLVQLIEYGIFNNMNPNQGGKLLFMAIWLLSYMLALAVMVTVRNVASIIWTIVISVIFLIICGYSLTSSHDTFNVKRGDRFLEWTRDDKDILHGLEILYLITIMIPILLLLYYYNFSDIGLYSVILFIIILGLSIWLFIPSSLACSVWFYSAIGLVMLLWVVNMFV